MGVGAKEILILVVWAAILGAAFWAYTRRRR
jgi:hypothetical protein